MESLLKELFEIEQELFHLNMRKKEITDKLLEELDGKNYIDENVRVDYIKETEVITIDKKKIEELLTPEQLEQVKKIIKRKPHLKITFYELQKLKKVMKGLNKRKEREYKER